MPSELLDATGDRLRDVGREFGTTTGRPRRCGWFDAVITRHACRTNGVDGLGIMKLDVLDGFDEVGMVVGYRDGEGPVSTRLPSCAADWNEIQPEVKIFKGWSSPHPGHPGPQPAARRGPRLPGRPVESVDTPIAYLSTGPDRVEGYVAAGSFLEPLLA